MPSSYQVALWKQESFVVLRPLQIEFFRNLLRMGFPIVSIALAEALPVTIVVAVQSIHQKGVCPYPAHLFIDVLAKVGNVKNSTPIVQVCVHQIFSEAFEQG
jgi:hypothetical protein